MEDLRLSIGLIGFVSVAIYMAMLRLLEGRSKIFLDIIAFLIVILIGAYVRTVWGQLWIVRWIPLSSVIVLSNWFPPLLAALAATVWLRLEPSTVARRLPIIGLIVASAIYSVTYFIPKNPPECDNRWTSGLGPAISWPVCLQTTKQTCSAAAAATILNTLNIETSEQEMARLCLTKSGTTWLGLYHGLSIKLRGSDFRVKFFEGSISELVELAKVHPVLLCCELDATVAEMVPAYVQEGGWIPGTAHSVVYFGELNGVHVIGDPSRGYEGWSSRDLNTLWTGAGLQIAQYSPDGSLIE